MSISIMLDSETLATTPNAVVLSLGAIKFDPFSMNNASSELYMRIDADDQIGKGRDVSDSTVEWWGQQPAEIREEALAGENRVAVIDALNALNKFLVGADKIWCQGPHFDITILESLYRQYGVSPNWQYWQIMDSRTVFGLFGDSRVKNKTTLHNAVEDCKSQARAIQQACKTLGITKYANCF